MNTITIWLLVVAGWSGSKPLQPTVLERFVSPVECQRVLKIVAALGAQQEMRCVEATVVRP